MKVIVLQKHFATPEIIGACQSVRPGMRDHAMEMSGGVVDTRRRLVDLADERIAHMDEAGIDVQVLSV